MTKFDKIVNEINGIVMSNHCFDFHILSYDGRNLTIAGGINLTYSHSLEVKFKDVFFVHGFFESFSTDTTDKILIVPDQIKNRELNNKFEIEKGYQVFIFKTDNFENDVYIAAKEIGYNQTIVKYFQE